MAAGSFELIENPSTLARALPRIRQCPVLCIDTEFHRENTYFPEFALLQIYGAQGCWLIDPLKIKDLSAVWEILTDRQKTKVFHAGRQDIEIIYRESGKLPLPLVDTQIAAALLGFGQQIGFANLVQKIHKKSLPKLESFSNWLIRPLSSRQLEYAADDVIYLMPIYQYLTEQLKIRKRMAWLDEEQQSLCDPATYQSDPEQNLWRIKGATRLKGKKLAVLRELATWREYEAQAKNIPRRRIITDETLVELARRDELDPDHLSRIRGLNAGHIKRYGEAIIQAWNKGRCMPVEQWPRPKSSPNHTPGTELRLELMDTLVRLKAETEQVAANILASKSELARLASWGYQCNGTPPEVSLLRGWRYRLVGNDLLRLLRGETCIHLDRECGLPAIANLDDIPK